MAGVKGMHEKLSTSPVYAAKVRARIKVGGIIHLLQKHILGEREMTTSQVTAALGLLRKVVPDTASVDHTGEISHNYVMELPQVAQTADEWSKQHSPIQTAH